MKQFKSVFTQDYFTEYYSAMTGDFSKKYLEKNINWFYGWFNVLMNWFDFREGQGRKVLEFGTAIGAASSILAERGFSVIATDISEYAIRKNKELHTQKNLAFEKMDVETSKKFTDEFDLAFGFEVIEHLPLPEKALKNLYRMLKKDGVLICSTPYPYAYVFRDETHVSVKHPLDWERLFRNAGFRNVKYKHVSFVPFLYRFSKYFHINFSFGLPTPYLNSTIFVYGQK